MHAWSLYFLIYLLDNSCVWSLDHVGIEHLCYQIALLHSLKTNSYSFSLSIFVSFFQLIAKKDNQSEKVSFLTDPAPHKKHQTKGL